MSEEQIAACVRSIPDFPKPGILFRDITPLLRNHRVLRLALEALLRPCRNRELSAVAACDARGFIFGSLMAWELGLPLVLLRKAGKLPAATHRARYQLEYDTAGLELHQGDLGSGERVVLVDDLLATGGTAEAGCRLLRLAGAEVSACIFLIELSALQGRRRLTGTEVHSVLQYGPEDPETQAAPPAPSP